MSLIEIPTKQSFLPLATDDAEVLILGSIPGDRSIELQQYYGHPQNRFWRVIAAVTDSELPTDYNAKQVMLIANGIALWDVAHRADRIGSLDSAIRNEEPNDITTFIASHPHLKTIAFNGKKAEQLYDRYFKRFTHIKYLSLPSTSPTNAACGIETLQDRWREITRQQPCNDR